MSNKVSLPGVCIVCLVLDVQNCACSAVQNFGSNSGEDFSNRVQHGYYLLTDTAAVLADDV